MIIFCSKTKNIGFVHKRNFSSTLVMFNMYNLKDDFEILELPLNSSKKDIKAAYIKRAKVLHPDNTQR